MHYEPFGPRGAEDERGSYWSNIAEGEDMLAEDPHALPRTNAPAPMRELASLAGFGVQDPYGPALTDTPMTEELPADDDAYGEFTEDTETGSQTNSQTDSQSDFEDDSDMQLYHPGETNNME